MSEIKVNSMQEEGNQKVLITNDNGETYEIYMDKWFREDSDKYKQMVRSDFDFLSIIFGKTGGGKSVLAFQWALYLDPNFNIDNVVFTSKQFKDAVNTAKPYSCIVWDEADEIDSANWRKQQFMTIKRLLKRIREYNLYIIMVTPTIFDMPPFHAVMRSHCCLYVDVEGLYKRGNFYFFNEKNKRHLYFHGKKNYWDVKKSLGVRMSFTDIPEHFPIDMRRMGRHGVDGNYSIKKRAATEELLGDYDDATPSEKLLRYKLECVERFYRVFEREAGRKPAQRIASEIFDVDQSMISRYINDKCTVNV